MKLETQVLIIGGGITGTAIARDLALRGVHSILIERSHINALIQFNRRGIYYLFERFN